MSVKTKKSVLKVVKISEAPAPTPIATKPEAKVTFCKEFECREKSQVSGYCRLHFLKLVKGATVASQARAQDKEEKEEKNADRWDRRKGSRSTGFESNDDIATAGRMERVEQLGNLDVDLTAILDGEDLDPFKKTG